MYPLVALLKSFHTLRWTPLQLALAACIFIILTCNAPLWQLILSQPYESLLQQMLFSLAFFTLMLAVFLLFLSLLSWPRLIKPVLVLLLLCAALVSHFMSSYGILIDKVMIQNLFETDMAETADLINVQLLVHLLLAGLLPALFLATRPIRPQRIINLLGQQLACVLACCVLLGLNAALFYKDYSSLFRNHREIRNLAVPSNFIYYTSRFLTGAYDATSRPFEQLGLDAVRKPPINNSNGKPDLTIVVLGETARSMNFALNGYPRNTTPELAQLPVISFQNVEACGTSTAVSVPCMFSLMTQASFDNAASHYQSNVLDILQRAGISLFWRDNNSGCKGVCSRIPHQSSDELGEQGCNQEECFDMQLLTGLEQWLHDVDGDAVVVLHQQGSHGPAYYKRVPEDARVFTPVCNSNQLQTCNQADIVNAYDNTIVYTDRLLAQVIRFLQNQGNQFNTAMVYISDHGESLGENNLYLHGMPWLLAPDEQKRVPLITWLSEDFQTTHGLDAECLDSRRSEPLNHDYLAHSLLGLMRVQTSVYEPTLDLFAPCTSSNMHLAQTSDNQGTPQDHSEG